MLDPEINDARRDGWGKGILEIKKRRLTLFADHVIIYLSKINQTKNSW